MELVTLVIKNPSRADDFTLEFAPSQSVRSLKQELSVSYPDKPTVETQKLIFAGRILNDDCSLQEVLQKCNLSIPQTFHLVIRPPRQALPQDGQLPNEHGQRVIQQGINANPAQYGSQRRGFINWGLLLKMLVLVYILGQGGGAERLVILMIGALAFYLYQVGALRMRIHRVGSAPTPTPIPAQQQGEPGERNEPRNAAPRTGVRREIENFVLPFIYSLIPSWNPHQAIVQPQNLLPQNPH